MSIEKSPAGTASIPEYELGVVAQDKDGKKLGKVRARFSQYILVERGGLFGKAYYVPKSAVKGITNGVIQLLLSEDDLRAQGLNSVPDDLYHEPPEFGQPKVTGVPLFGQRPLSPAETGHYNYGRRSPGINTDASGSYFREDVMPTPQNKVGETVFTTDNPIEPRELSSN
ncbi:MAG TPA: hypothetical protein VNE38_11155 [Ktedonobacteraceae bacterium]|nr:hypothetical protein [Ktedonobacteraceae bacterium]